jgi:hypothetical protein
MLTEILNMNEGKFRIPRNDLQIVKPADQTNLNQ